MGVIKRAFEQTPEFQLAESLNNFDTALSDLANNLKQYQNDVQTISETVKLVKIKIAQMVAVSTEPIDDKYDIEEGIDKEKVEYQP